MGPSLARGEAVRRVGVWGPAVAHFSSPPRRCSATGDSDAWVALSSNPTVGDLWLLQEVNDHEDARHC